MADTIATSPPATPSAGQPASYPLPPATNGLPPPASFVPPVPVPLLSAAADCVEDLTGALIEARAVASTVADAVLAAGAAESDRESRAVALALATQTSVERVSEVADELARRIEAADKNVYSALAVAATAMRAALRNPDAFARASLRAWLDVFEQSAAVRGMRHE